MSFVQPYGFVQPGVGKSSRIGTLCGWPYTVAELENTMFLQSCAASTLRSVNVPPRLLL